MSTTELIPTFKKKKALYQAKLDVQELVLKSDTGFDLDLHYLHTSLFRGDNRKHFLIKEVEKDYTISRDISDILADIDNAPEDKVNPELTLVHVSDVDKMKGIFALWAKDEETAAFEFTLGPFEIRVFRAYLERLDHTYVDDCQKWSWYYVIKYPYAGHYKTKKWEYEFFLDLDPVDFESRGKFLHNNKHLPYLQRTNKKYYDTFLEVVQTTDQFEDYLYPFEDTEEAVEEYLKVYKQQLGATYTKVINLYGINAFSVLFATITHFTERYANIYDSPFDIDRIEFLNDLIMQYYT